MWFLTHESLFGGKRIWLRPGSQQLFGRTKPGDGDRSGEKKVFIDNKNVSRKHMMVQVLNVSEGDGTKLHARSQVEITDFSCRQGTVVDGQTLKSTKETDGTIAYNRVTLTGTEHTVRLSASYPAFTIKWHDVVLTNAAKEKKESEKSKTRNAQLHAVDIKTSSDFVYGKTTHVVSQKRNLPKVLQALVSGTPIVTTVYLDAILNVATSTLDMDGNYVPSSLEDDFDRWWPKDREYVPPAGAEPVARPENMLEPDTGRSEVFSGLTFIFFNESQHSSLHQVIAGGGGKALLYDIRLGETTVEEYVEYVRNVAGQKRRSKGDKSTLPVVTIRISAYSEDLEDWATDFVTRVDHLLHQRSILQNEFLDAIITKDASSLRRPPADLVKADSSMAPQAPSELSVHESAQVSQTRATSQARTASSAPPEESLKTVSRKRPIRRGPTSRFTGFDDYEPPSKIRKVEDTPMEDIQESILGQEPSQSQPITQTRHTVQSQVASTVERGDQMEQLFPAAAAIKRQRAATRAPSASVEPEVQPSAQRTRSRAAGIVEQLQKTKKKVDKEINVREEARKRIEAEEEKRRAQEESLRDALEGVDISEIRASIKLEEMLLRPREERPDTRAQAQSDRWNPDWNGRKNFKKFRRKGAEQGPQSPRVLVTFEEAPQKKGFGESAFLLEDTEPPVRTKEDERRLKRRIGRAPDSESEPETGFVRRKRAKAAEVIDVEDSGPDGADALEDSAPPRSGRTQRVVETQLEDTQTQGGSRKRGSASVASGQPSSKRSRTARRDDDSDEEETGFRFRRRA